MSILKSFSIALTSLALCLATLSCIVDRSWELMHSTFGEPRAKLIFRETGTSELVRTIFCNSGSSEVSISGEGYTEGRVILRFSFSDVKGENLKITPKNVTVSDFEIGEIPIWYAPRPYTVKKIIGIAIFYGKKLKKRNSTSPFSDTTLHTIRVSMKDIFSTGNTQCSLDTIVAEYKLMPN